MPLSDRDSFTRGIGVTLIAGYNSVQLNVSVRKRQTYCQINRRGGLEFGNIKAR